MGHIILATEAQVVEGDQTALEGLEMIKEHQNNKNEIGDMKRWQKERIFYVQVVEALNQEKEGLNNELKSLKDVSI